MKHVKRFVCIALTLFLSVGLVEVNAKEDYSEKQMKRFEKSAEKSAKKRVKELKKEKWLYNGSADLQMKLADHMLETNEFGGTGIERVIDIPEAPSIVVGEKLARSNVEQDFAREIRTMLKGQIDTHTKADGKYANDIYIDNWSAKVVQELKGDIRKNIVLSKKNKDNTYWVRVYFVLDQNSRRRALEDIAAEIKDDNELAAAIRRAAEGADE